MTILLFANNAKTSLASPITSTQTTCTVLSGTGNLFPSPAAGQGFKLTFNDLATGFLNEIVLCTSRTGDVLTIVRGQEGTTAQSWVANDLAGMFYTAGSEENNIQVDQFQIGTYNNAIANGTVNALTATIPSNLNYIPTNFEFVLTAAFANTGATTLNLTIGSTVTGIKPIVKSDNIPLIPGDIANTGYPCFLAWSPTYNAYVLLNPATGNSNALSPAQLQEQFYTYAIATGTSENIAVSYLSTLNGTITGTFPIVRGLNNTLIAADIAGAGYVCDVVWSTAYNAWLLLNPYFTPAQLGTMSLQNANAVAITGGSISGISPPVPVASGGTGQASLNPNAVLIGNGTGAVNNVPPSNIGNVLISNGTNWYSGSTGLGGGGTVWQNVTGGRSFNVTYTNTRPYPIMVNILTNTNFEFNGSIVVQGITVTAVGINGNGTALLNLTTPMSTIIPAGASYYATVLTGSVLSYTWLELY